MKNKEKKSKVTATLSYRIYKITDEGHFVEPETSSWGNNIDFLFDHWNGYPEIKDAQKAIREYGNSDKTGYGFLSDYVILPIVRLSKG